MEEIASCAKVKALIYNAKTLYHNTSESLYSLSSSRNLYLEHISLTGFTMMAGDVFKSILILLLDLLLSLPIKITLYDIYRFIFYFS